MLDNCGWDISIRGQRCSLIERMGGMAEGGATEAGTGDSTDDKTAQLHHGETFVDEETAFPETRGTPPAQEIANSTANASTPQELEPDPRIQDTSPISPPHPSPPVPTGGSGVGGADIQKAWNPPPES